MYIIHMGCLLLLLIGCNDFNICFAYVSLSRNHMVLCNVLIGLDKVFNTLCVEMVHHAMTKSSCI